MMGMIQAAVGRAVSVGLLATVASQASAAPSFECITSAQPVGGLTAQDVRSGRDEARNASDIARLLCLADAGDLDARLQIARRLELGDGLPQDAVLAARLYERAAAGQTETSAIYMPPVRIGGSGRTLLIAQPRRLGGSAEAQYRLGLMFIDGRGTARDQPRGIALLARAAAAGHEAAELQLLNWLQVSAIKSSRRVFVRPSR